MKCGYCGRPLPDEPDPRQQPCDGCLGGCRKIHCPHCGYANPVVAGWFRRRRKKAVTKEKQDDPIE